MNNRNIIITGFMGVGKTLIGQALAKEMGMSFVDTDDLIKKKCGKNIRTIFSTHGERYFRNLEQQMCCNVSGESGAVISTGGGALIFKKNKDFFNQSTIFCLTAPVQVIRKRLLNDFYNNKTRPLMEMFEELWHERKPLYDEIFHQIENYNCSVKLVVEKMIELYILDTRFKSINKDIFCPVVIKNNIIEEITYFLKWISLFDRKICIITHPELNCLNSIQYKLKNVLIINIPSGEKSKSLTMVNYIYKKLLANNFTRNDALIAFGGGVVGDVTGFVAGTFLRGINLVHVPTSLLAMIDSSIGGKSGINLSKGKNLIGVFKKPAGVLIDPNLLQTLPEEEKRSGLAEAVKHAIIGDPILFHHLEHGLINFSWIVDRATEVKIKIVKEDFLEKNERAFLNFGHTFGHAIEIASNYEIKHGEAISIGMVYAARYASIKGICDTELVARIENLLHKLQLPTKLPCEITIKDLRHFIKHDKKRFGSMFYIIVPKKIGEVQKVEFDLGVFDQ